MGACASMLYTSDQRCLSTACRTLACSPIRSSAVAVPWSTPQYPTVPWSTLQYPTVPYSTIKYPTVPYSTLQYHKIPYSTLQHPTVPYSTLQYHKVPYSTLGSACAVPPGRESPPRRRGGGAPRRPLARPRRATGANAPTRVRHSPCAHTTSHRWWAPVLMAGCCANSLAPDGLRLPSCAHGVGLRRRLRRRAGGPIACLFVCLLACLFVLLFVSFCLFVFIR